MFHGHRKKSVALIAVICFAIVIIIYNVFFNRNFSEQRKRNRSGQEDNFHLAVRVFSWGSHYPSTARSAIRILDDERISCEWTRSSNLTLMGKMARNSSTSLIKDTSNLITVGNYEVHNLYHNLHSSKPFPCILPANISLFESWEAYCRFSDIYNRAFPNFDGYLSTYARSDVQVMYDNLTDLAEFPRKPFTSLIKGASYGASECHTYENDQPYSTRRDLVVMNLTHLGLRVDSFGKCLRSKKLPDEVEQLTKVRDYPSKKKILNHYAFYLAFENSREEGYVTEKIFDGLRAGTVPVYLGGDSVFLKSLIPHPKAVIFVDDFPRLQHLVRYLSYLLTNETAYEEHREWRKTWDREKFVADKPLLRKSLDIRVCEWAANQYQLLQQSKKQQSGQKDIKHKIGNRVCESPSPLG